MLKHLSVENYILIDKLEIDFKEGLTIITGETGAGKSILLGALALILGHRADAQALFDKNRKCVVEGVFDVENINIRSFFKDNDLDFEEVTIIRREISPQAKSRAFINDTPVNLNQIKELASRLIDIHSQHKTLELENENFQTSVIDSFAQQNDTVKKYQQEYSKFIGLKKKLNELITSEKQSSADRDYIQFQFDELDKAGLDSINIDELENEQKIQSNAETICANLSQVVNAINEDENNIISSLNAVQQLVSTISNIDKNFAEITERLYTVNIELKDITNDISSYLQKIIFDPLRLQEVNDRLSNIYHLFQKHHLQTVEELIDCRNKLSDQLFTISSLEEEISVAQKECIEQEKIVADLADQLHQVREKAIPEAEKRLLGILEHLGMPDARIIIEFIPLENFNELGKERLRFLFNANKGADLNELSKVASGGELSRLMLSVKSLISENNLLPTIIFDEIDTGVSGEIAGKVGEILYLLSRNMQVVSITHLPRIAAFGDTHFTIYKESTQDSTHTYVREIRGYEREVEIARMIGGNSFTEKALATAKDMINAKVSV